MRVQLALVGLDQGRERGLVALLRGLQEAAPRSSERPPSDIQSGATDEFAWPLWSHVGAMSNQAPVVHLELHTNDLPSARDLYGELCGWQPDRVDTRHGSYLALDMGRRLGGGIVESSTAKPLWLPYVEVGDISSRPPITRSSLGAALLLAPREGPAGWRSVISLAGRRGDRVLAAEALAAPGALGARFQACARSVAASKGRFRATPWDPQIAASGSRTLRSFPSDPDRSLTNTCSLR